MLKKIIIAATFAAFATGTVAVAQQMAPQMAAPSPIKRIPLQKFDVPGAGYETVMGIAEIAPNVNIGKHTHFGIEGGYLISGDLTLLEEGKPEKVLKPGDSYQFGVGSPHDAKSGAAGAKVLAVYVVEKGKPLVTPAK